MGDNLNICRWVNARMQQLIQIVRGNTGQGSLFINQAFLNHLNGDTDSRLPRTFAVTGLEHIEFTVLDREFHVLHIGVVLLKSQADIDQFIIRLGQNISQFGDWKGGSDASDDVFALCINEEFAIKLVCAGRRVTGESDA